MVTLRTDLPFAFGFLYQAGGTAVRQPTDPHSTFALGLIDPHSTFALSTLIPPLPLDPPTLIPPLRLVCLESPPVPGAPQLRYKPMGKLRAQALDKESSSPPCFSVVRGVDTRQ